MYVMKHYIIVGLYTFSYKLKSYIVGLKCS